MSLERMILFHVKEAAVVSNSFTLRLVWSLHDLPLLVSNMYVIISRIVHCKTIDIR